MKKPNIIVYFSDQQRADTLGCYGQPLDISPNLDKLAKEGTLFENAFSPQPVCGPCRAIFQTGKYATDTGCFRNSIALPNDSKTIAHYLENDGYKTAYVGKWHLASTGNLEEKPYQDFQKIAIPQELRGGYTGYWRGSDILEFTSDGYGGFLFDENNNKCEFDGYRCDCITDYALDFLKDYKEESPFMLFLSHIEPHHQNDAYHYQGPKGSEKKYKNFILPTDLETLGGDAAAEYPQYLGQCNSLDTNLGRIIEELKIKGLYDNTVIIYVSDHGSHFNTRNKDSHLNGYDDYKRTCHDSALKVPLIIAGGKYNGGNVVKRLVSTESLAKTILSIADIDVSNKMIGENLLDEVNHLNDNKDNEIYAQISESRLGRCIRTDKYLYSVYAPNINGGEKASSSEYLDDYLYDLEKDPFQLNNVVEDNSYNVIKFNLRVKLIDWIQKVEHLFVTIN
ncbi:MAG: sulfatase-like hydrolase/transferase [Spirochaetaceae bacterium]|nr:sulfatase-like hydrolase/transferase [Spirochaetaceae bacterium]